MAWRPDKGEDCKTPVVFPAVDDHSLIPDHVFMSKIRRVVDKRERAAGRYFALARTASEYNERKTRGGGNNDCDRNIAATSK
jgi:hypothetical protein